MNPPPLRAIWTIIAAVAIAALFITGATCENDIGNYLDPGAQDCSSQQGERAGIAFLVWLIGFVTLTLFRPRPSKPPPSADPIDQLNKLAALRDKGAITDGEYDAQKARLLP